MLLVSWLGWWYGQGWRELAISGLGRLRRIYETFSVPLLFQTLGAPWRRITTSSQGSLGQRMRAVVDNAVSRCVGFIVRLLALVLALFLMFMAAVGSIAIFILWPLIPIGGIIDVIWGIFH